MERAHALRAFAAAAALLALAAPGRLGAQETALFADDFESGSLWPWSRLPGGVDPRAVCPAPVAPVDMTGAVVVGAGTPASCDEAALDAGIAAALAGAGKLGFDCGDSPHTIVVSAEKSVAVSLAIDGGGLVTLSGGGATRILALRPPFGADPYPVLTLQSLTLADGYTGDLSGSDVANGGAAVYRGPEGHLHVLDSRFVDNVGPASGQDVAGGAIYSFGAGETIVVRSRFTGNRCSSGGAIGGLGVSAQSLSIVNSLLDGNAATGSGGNPGNGGNGGGVYLDGANQTVTLCGTTISANDANARGGGLFRVSNNGVGAMTIEKSAILSNEIPDNASSQAGGLYLQGLQTTITDSTIAENVASSTGGAFVWTNPGAQTLAMTNVTVAGNRARTGLGAGLAVASGVTGTLHHVTIARNHNDGAASFASALAGGAGLAITNSLVADNSKVFVWEDTSCNLTHGGGPVWQWPATNAGGEAELPCAAGATFLDPQLGPLAWSGGATPVILPGAAALDGAATSGCPAADQRGFARSSSCTPGAAEMP